ncbi:hypothetical protein [Halomarina rubra]|uniref:Uncharacterized protein n=1 Tax=Halomarina rubra TaxID=2071873 RepID=A0ABD6AZ70_9EURY|nr:hypothetical protein [Halomarina rubra]
MSSKQRADPLLILAVLSVGIATRLLPWHLSPLPFNTDAFVFVRRAEQIQQANRLAFVGPTAPAPDEYLFDMLLAMSSEVVGIQPLYFVQILIACLAIIPSLIAVSYARSLTRGLPRTYQRGAAAFAGIGLSIEGLYLWRTATISSEVYGLAFVAIIVFALHWGITREDRRLLALAVVLSSLMPAVHNGSTFILGLILTTLVAIVVTREFTARRALIGMLGVVGFWLLAFGYNELVELPYSATISAAPGLFIGWTILITMLARWLDIAGSPTQRAIPVGLFGLGSLVFVLNAALPVFPGMPSTSPLLLLFTLPLVALLIVAAYGTPLVTTKSGIAMFAVTVGPLAALGFALTGGRTADYQALLTRSTTFMHLGVLVITAVTLAMLVHRRPTLGRVAVVVVVLAILVSAPFPFSGLETKPFEAVTEPSEFEAAMFGAEYTDGGWASDDHLSHIATKYRGEDVSDISANAWLRGESGPPQCPTMSRESWTTTGAPAVPEPLRISSGAYDQWVMTGDVVYSGGAAESIVLHWEPGTCNQPPVGNAR